jgi:ComF family protein
MESLRFASALGVTECTLCRMAPPDFARAVAFAPYDNELRDVLHLLKFEGQRSLATHLLADGLANAILQLRERAAAELTVIPVPLFAARQRSRGFNQSALLATAALKRLHKLAPAWQLTLDTTILERTKDTRALFTLAPHQRRAGLRGAFRVANPAAVQDREVLLLDDILTTGATARECSRVLLRAGATKVWVATVARAQPEAIAAVESANNIARWDAPPPFQQPNPHLQRSF